MQKSVKKVLGLDIGTTSVGWAVNKKLEDGSWTIDDFGVHIFNEPVKDGTSSSMLRRVHRSQRRMLNRRRRRIQDLKYYLQKYDIISIEEIDNHFEKIKDKNNKEYRYNKNFNPYFIREKALNEPVTQLQFAIALINIAKRRGYDQSFKLNLQNESVNNKNDGSQKKKTEKDLKIEYKNSIIYGRELIEKYKYPILAIQHWDIKNDKNENVATNNEYQYTRNNTEFNFRNRYYRNDKNKLVKKDITYKSPHQLCYFSRDAYLEEVKAIIKMQKNSLKLSDLKFLYQVQHAPILIERELYIVLARFF